MEDNMNAALAISDILMDAINKKYDSVRDLNSIKVNISEEGFDDMNPVIDSIIEEENNNIGKFQQLVDLLSGGEEEIAEGKEETIEMIDNSDEFMESMTTMKKKLILSENFDNVIDDVQAVADPVFVGANEEHDENKKKYEDAIKENEKEAKETIPEEGDTGKKVTSPELKKMKLSEKLFDEALGFDTYSEFNSAVYNAIADAVYEYQDQGITKSDIENALEWFELHFFDDNDIEEDPKINHMTGVHESYEVKTTKEYDNGSMDRDILKDGKKIGEIWDDGTIKLTNPDQFTDEEKKSIEKAAGGSILKESLPVKIAKEQLSRFNEGKMPSDFNVDTYLEALTEKKHITEKEAESLKEWFVNGSK